MLMTKFGKFVVFLILLAISSSFYFYFKKSNEVITLVDETRTGIKSTTTESFGVNSGSSTEEYVFETLVDKTQGITFQYPKQLLTKYIHPVEWPPKMTVISGTFNCVESGTAITQTGKTEKRIIASTTYCVTYLNNGAAGSTYTDYTYKTLKNNNVVTVTFSLRAVQCANYDDPNKTECENERKTFNIDNIINNIISTIKFITVDIPVKKGGISGTVIIGPMCPVMRDPPDPKCADKPYKTQLVITAKDSSQVIKEFSSDENGKFSVELAPGEYLIKNISSASSLPYCASNNVIKVISNTFTTADISCDSGIR